MSKTLTEITELETSNLILTNKRTAGMRLDTGKLGARNNLSENNRKANCYSVDADNLLS